MATSHRRSVPARFLARAAALAAALLVTVPLAGPASAAPPRPGLGGFDAGNLISDSVMFDGARMSASQIDQKLAQLGAKCDSSRTSAPCLKDLKVDTPARAATKYCKAVPARTQVSAGQMIADAGSACNVNPQVIIVMLQKEQSLVATTEPNPTRYAKARGFACPDFQQCSPAFAGIVNQVYSAASRLQEYGDLSRGFDYRAGRTYDIGYSPFPFCPQARVTIKNRATAALYNYTPYTPNQKVLDNGTADGLHDACSMDANNTFFRLFSQWFGTPNGADPSAPAIAAPLGKQPSAPFRDVPLGLQFFTEISWAKWAGITTGFDDGTYRPTTPISREAMAAYLYRAAGSPAFTVPAGQPFTDVSASSTPFVKEIAWLKAQGITTGYSDGSFHPAEPISREAMAAFLYRRAGSPAVRTGTVPLTDIDPSQTGFTREITWLYRSGVTTGWPDGTFRPTAPINRDAMAAFLYRQKF